MTTHSPDTADERPPKVSVLLPVHNGANYVESAVRSMMAQTLREIEIVVVDDASSDGTPGILDRLAAEDGRIRVERLEPNRRLPGALNRGLELCRGEYVARMDADDLSEPTRLEVQARFLDSHPDITLVGCSVIRIDGDGKPFQTSVRAQDPFAARWMCRFMMPFRHPTFLFRRTEMDLAYDPACTVSEDFDILARLTETRKVVCLPDVLLRYREHDGSLTGAKWRLMVEEAEKIAVPVQKTEMPAEVFEAMAPFRTAYFDLRPLDGTGIAALFEGLKRMAQADALESPAHRDWIRRQTAQLGAHALLRSGARKPRILAAFFGPGRDFLPALVMRFLETRRLLPAAFRSDPVIWRA